jgi:hypothetical protein
MDGISLDLRAEWIDDLAAREHYGALFSADPFGVGTPTSVELAGALYTRQDTTGLWTRSGPALLTLSTAVVWRNLAPGAVVAAVGFMDTAFGAGGLLHRALVDPPGSYPSGGTFLLPAGEYGVGLDL